MWIVLGTKEKSERVPNGRRFESQCQACGEVAMFYERRTSSTLQLYFLDVVDYGSRLVMACGACGTLYATGDATNAQPDMIAKAKKTAGELGSAIASGATRAAGRVSDAARDLLGSGSGSTSSKPAEREEELADPLLEDDEALEAKFRALEKRVRIDTGEK
jgi:photosystem II stability/assembly factor-like uncharacterized protein